MSKNHGSEDIRNIFNSLNYSKQNEVLKDLLTLCTSKQLQLLHNESKQLLAVNFVKLLPGELVYRIFSLLTAKELARASMVSSDWREAINSDSLWKNIIKKGKRLIRDKRVLYQKQTYSKDLPHPRLKAFTLPTYTPVIQKSKELEHICKNKELYTRIVHLHNNWTLGR